MRITRLAINAARCRSQLVLQVMNPPSVSSWKIITETSDIIFDVIPMTD